MAIFMESTEMGCMETRTSNKRQHIREDYHEKWLVAMATEVFNRTSSDRVFKIHRNKIE